jgi:hypothetical protein
VLIASKDQRWHSGFGRGAIHHDSTRPTSDVNNSREIILDTARGMLGETLTGCFGSNDFLDEIILQASAWLHKSAIAITNCQQLQAQAILQRVKGALFNDLAQQGAAHTPHTK